MNRSTKIKNFAVIEAWVNDKEGKDALSSAAGCSVSYELQVPAKRNSTQT